jgi:predicted PurR-regulated permease PerM
MVATQRESQALGGEEPLSRQPRTAWDKRAWLLSVRIILLVLAISIGAWLFYTLRSVLLLLLIATILATGLHPLVHQLERLRLPRAAAVLVLYLGLLLALIGLVAVVVPPVINELQGFVRNIPVYGDALGRAVQGLAQRFPALGSLDAQVTELVRGLSSQLGAVAGQLAQVFQLVLNLLNSMLSLLFILLMTFYLLVDGGRIRGYLLSFVAPSQRAQLETVTDRIGDRLGRWLVGEMVICTVVGLMAFGGLSLIGVRGALVLGLIAAVGEFIPNIGPYLSAIPAVLIALTQSPVQAGLVVVLFVVIHQVDFLLLVPKVMQQAVRIHPLAVVLALLIGGELFGLIGALVAVPTATALTVVLDEVRATHAGADSA